MVKILVRHMVKVMNRFDDVYSVTNLVTEACTSYGYKKPVGIFRNGSVLTVINDLDKGIDRVNDIYYQKTYLLSFLWEEL
ncbi:hypothetical protein FACS1894166_06220 [Bacilli bacterium]|nr:hypothetical protein FACS1894166_06220 [Bacilli bacterium]